MTPRRWLAVGAGLVVLDVHESHRHGVTLSAAARGAYRTHTPTGRAALVGSWAALTAWLIPHLLKQVAEAVEAVGIAIEAAHDDLA